MSCDYHRPGCHVTELLPGAVRLGKWKAIWPEKTWQAPQMGAKLMSLLPTYKEYPNRPLQTAGVSGAVFEAEDAQVQQQVHEMMHALLGNK